MSRRDEVSVNRGRRAILAASPLLLAPAVQAKDLPPAPDGYASWDAQQLRLANGAVERILRLPTQQQPYLTTIDYRSSVAPSRFFTGHDGRYQSQSDEFRFLFDGRLYHAGSGWRLTGIVHAADGLQGKGAEVRLASSDGALEVRLQYLLYPGLPLVRKQVAVRNLGTREAALESLECECFNFEEYWPGTMSWVYSDYGRRKLLVPFSGGAQDSLVALHHPGWGEGIVLGSEAAGISKYIAAFDQGRNFKAGLAPRHAALPFRHWLVADAEYVAPQVFSIVYVDTPRFEQILNTVVPDFVRRHMGIRLSALAHKPHFVYNTWEPFGFAIDEALIRETATAAAAAGVKEFVIDDGWQDKYGDWGVDRRKFPNGLRPVMDHIRALGMKPGLWVSIGSADPGSRIFAQHPEWFSLNSKGVAYSIAEEEAINNKFSACFSTGWKDYIQRVLLDLVQQLGLEYLKLDFSVVTSPYRFDTANVGCHASGHPGHRDHAESLSRNYEPMWEVFDALHAAHPGLFIDCTFEAMGALQLIDYAMLKHAEGNWLSNFGDGGSRNDVRIRQMAWWRSPAMPATALVVGNALLDEPQFMLHLRSLAGALPMLLGDPRKLSGPQRAACRAFSSWLARMQAQYDVLGFRQDLPGFGEPQEGAWDGFQRMNTETQQGGIVGIFRHGAADIARQVRVAGLAPRALYVVRDEAGREVVRQTGRQLSTLGWRCALDQPYDGRLYEVGRIA